MMKFEKNRTKILLGSVAIGAAAICGLLSLAYGSRTLMYASLLVVSAIFFSIQKDMGLGKKSNYNGRTTSHQVIGYLCLALSLAWIFFAPSLLSLDPRQGSGLWMFFGGAGLFALIGITLLLYSEVKRWIGSLKMCRRRGK